MRSFRIPLVLVGAILASMISTIPAISSARAAGVGAAAFTSDNVQWLSVKPQHAGSSGGRLHQGYFYVTDPRGLTIYNVADPEQPALASFLPIAQGGTGTGNATHAVLGQEDPDTNGKILLLEGVDPKTPANGFRLYIIDVSNKTAPVVLGSLETSDHTWTCVADCKYAYGRTGGIIDLTNPASPQVVSNWKTTVSGSGYTHDFTEVGPGRVMSAGQNSFYLDVTDPTKPKKLSTIVTKFHTLGYHSAEWPREGKDKFLLMGTELAAAGTTNLAGSDCTADGEIATYDATDILAAEQYVIDNPGEPFPPATFKKVDKWRIAGAGTYTDGKAPFHSTLYCAHWFDPHPNFNDGGLIAAAHYDWGARFLNVDPAGDITEIAWYQPVGGLTASAYWISEDIVYTLDYRRGMDILRFAGPTGPAPTPDTGLPTERVFFACGSRLANQDGTGGAAVAGWDTTAPTTSATAGGGCGAVDSPFTQTAAGNLYDATFSGAFTGNLNSLTVEAHNIYAGPGRASTPTAIAAHLFVDGIDLTPGANGAGKFVTLTPVRSETGATEMFKFSITNIGFTSPADAGEHEVQLVLNGGTRRSTGPSVNDAANVWVYDATEVPSGITFNPATLEPASIKAHRPA